MSMFPKIVLPCFEDYCPLSDGSKPFLSDVLARAEFHFILGNEFATVHRNVYQVGELFASLIAATEREETWDNGLKRTQAAMKFFVDGLNADEKVHFKKTMASTFDRTFCISEFDAYGGLHISEKAIRWTAFNWKTLFTESFVQQIDLHHLLLYLATVIAFCKHGECSDGILWRIRYILLKNYQKPFEGLNHSLVASIWTEYGPYADNQAIQKLFAQWKDMVPTDVSVELWSAISYIAWYDRADYKLVTDSLRAYRDFPWSRLERMIPTDFTNYAKVVRAMGNHARYNLDGSTSAMANKKFNGLVHCAKQLFIMINGQTDAVSEFHFRQKNVFPTLKRHIDGLVGCYMLQKLKGQLTHEEGEMTAEMSAFIDALPDLGNPQLEYDTAGLPDYRASVGPNFYCSEEDNPYTARNQESGTDTIGEMKSLAN